MTETEGRRWFKKLAGERLIVQPIESGGTGLGIPDLFIRSKFHSYWMELKQVTMFTSRGDPVLLVTIPFRTGQHPWLKRYTQFGGRALLMCLFDDELQQPNVAVFKGIAIKQAYTYTEFLSFLTYSSSLKTFMLSVMLQAIGDY